MLIRWKKLYKI